MLPAAHARKSRLSKAKRLCQLEHIARGTTARAAAEPASVNRNRVNRFYFSLRQIISEEMEKAAPLHGEVEVDENNFRECLKRSRFRVFTPPFVTPTARPPSFELGPFWTAWSVRRTRMNPRNQAPGVF